MTVEELWQQFRVEVDDRADPPLWPFDEFLMWLNEAQDEASVRSRLLFENTQAAVCEYAVAADQASVALHAAVCEITHARFLITGTTDPFFVGDRSRLELDAEDPNWRARTGTPKVLIHDESSLQLVPRPDAAGTLFIECHRLPLQRLKGDADQPEVHRRHHRNLLEWVKYRAYSKPDSEHQDLDRAARGEAEFIRYFGLRPDAETRRTGMVDRPQFNKAIW